MEGALLDAGTTFPSWEPVFPPVEETQAPTKGKSFRHLIKHPPCNTDLTKHGGCFIRCRSDFPFVGTCVSSSFSEVRVA
jgi:hypothetical protein